MLDPLTVVQTEALPAAVVRLTIPRDQIREHMGAAIGEVMEAVAAQGVGPAGPLYSFHFSLPPDQFDFEVGIPVSGAFTPAGRVRPGELPAMSAVRTVYTGPYEGLGEAWGEFKDRIAQGGREIAEIFWERYLTDPVSEPDSSRFRTELNVALR
ncbi:MAG: GyrI-like domain-containing protein [Verrucomicrobiae bacterium]|nr:GyrI-like domain-containing protein [Verrucomicrobiae bacterium]MCP5549999.1 GyrI-like domain-containing protein [Akkermansiaceae bacterium]